MPEHTVTIYIGMFITMLTREKLTNNDKNLYYNCEEVSDPFETSLLLVIVGIRSVLT